MKQPRIKTRLANFRQVYVGKEGKKLGGHENPPVTTYPENHIHNKIHTIIKKEQGSIHLGSRGVLKVILSSK